MLHFCYLCVLVCRYDTLYHCHPNGSPASYDDVEVFNSLRNRVNKAKGFIYENMYIIDSRTGCDITIL